MRKAHTEVRDKRWVNMKRCCIIRAVMIVDVKNGERCFAFGGNRQGFQGQDRESKSNKRSFHLDTPGPRERFQICLAIYALVLVFWNEDQQYENPVNKSSPSITAYGAKLVPLGILRGDKNAISVTATYSFISFGSTYVFQIEK